MWRKPLIDLEEDKQRIADDFWLKCCYYNTFVFHKAKGTMPSNHIQRLHLGKLAFLTGGSCIAKEILAPTQSFLVYPTPEPEFDGWFLILRLIYLDGKNLHYKDVEQTIKDLFDKLMRFTVVVRDLDFRDGHDCDVSELTSEVWTSIAFSINFSVGEQGDQGLR